MRRIDGPGAPRNPSLHCPYCKLRYVDLDRFEERVRVGELVPISDPHSTCGHVLIYNSTYREVVEVEVEPVVKYDIRVSDWQRGRH